MKMLHAASIIQPGDEEIKGGKKFRARKRDMKTRGCESLYIMYYMSSLAHVGHCYVDVDAEISSDTNRQDGNCTLSLN